MNKYCWYCDQPITTNEGQDLYKCTNCGVENDFSPYKPITEEQKEDNMAIPKIYDVDFIDWAVDVKTGDTLTIANEFTDMKPKFKAFMTGEVILVNGDKRLLGLNKTSYINISSVHGKDTATWIGKKIKFNGEKKMGAMNGREFVAC